MPRFPLRSREDYPTAHLKPRHMAFLFFIHTVTGFFQNPYFSASSQKNGVRHSKGKGVMLSDEELKALRDAFDTLEYEGIYGEE